MVQKGVRPNSPFLSFHLIRDVEEGQVFLLLDDVSDALPLVGRGVHPSRVVGAAVQKDDGPVWGSLEGATGK